MFKSVEKFNENVQICDNCDIKFAIFPQVFQIFQEMLGKFFCKVRNMYLYGFRVRSPPTLANLLKF